LAEIPIRSVLASVTVAGPEAAFAFW